MSETTNEAESTFLGIYLEHAGLDDLLGPGATDLYYQKLILGFLPGLNPLGFEDPREHSLPLPLLWRAMREHSSEADLARWSDLNLGELLSGIKDGSVRVLDPSEAGHEELSNLAAVYLRVVALWPLGMFRGLDVSSPEVLVFRWGQKYGYCMTTSASAPSARMLGYVSNPTGELYEALRRYSNSSTFLDYAFDAIKDQELLDGMSIGDLIEYLHSVSELMRRRSLDGDPAGEPEEIDSYTLGDVKAYRESECDDYLRSQEAYLESVFGADSSTES